MIFKLDVLDDIRIAAPCPAAWDDMHGDDRVRHCDQCDKHVYNIAEMTRREAAELISGDQASLCLRVWRRQDGTVITSDCPVGLRIRQRARKWVAAVAGFLGLAMTASSGCIMGATVDTGFMAPIAEDRQDEDTNVRNVSNSGTDDQANRRAMQPMIDKSANGH
ncbi:MAG: hypothetical protein H6819_10660 [Phycisphaerales bacterium]|nr:hypothetical protein [Phycisphaerales bacterium]MCB9854392.1 hypothetical protein [Phycisphaerales bacterium]MCB9863593.1 hypothetical protein [Phycisphaerales bacterium]